MSNQIISMLGTAGIYVGLIAYLVVKVFEFMKAHNKPIPQKYDSIYQIAEFIVAQFDTLDISNEEKKKQATQAVIAQAKVDGKTITETVAKGAVETAVKARNDEATDKPTSSENSGEAKPIGFINE